MKTALAVVVFTFAWGVDAAEPIFPPAVNNGNLEISEALKRELNEFQSQLNREIEARGCEALTKIFPAALKWCQHAFPDADAPMRFEYTAWFSVGNAVMADVQLRIDKLKRSTGYGAFTDRSVLLREQNQWSIRSQDALTQDAQLDGLQAKVSISPAAEWYEASVMMNLSHVSTNVIFFELNTRNTGRLAGVRILEVSQDETPLKYKVFPQGVAVELKQISQTLRILMRYAGEAVQSESDYIRADDVMLRGESGWLPRLGESRPDFRVLVTGPKDFTFFGQGIASQAKVKGDQKTQMFTSQGTDFTLYGAPAYVERKKEFESVPVTLAWWPKDATQLPKIESQLAAAFAALRVLGKNPVRELRVVESDYHLGRAGYGAFTNIALGHRIEANERLPFIAHELAHSWFGGVVQLSKESREKGQWNESFAEYVSSWVLNEKDAAKMKDEWRICLDAAGDSKNAALVDIGSRNGWRVHRGVTYCKGALILAWLEVKIGRAKMVDLFKEFIRARHFKPSNWEDFLTIAREKLAPPVFEQFQRAVQQKGDAL